MKYIFIILSILLFTGLYASELSSAVEVNTLNHQKTQISFKMPRYSIENEIANETNQSFQRIKMDEGLPSPEAGLPELPIFSTSIAVPVNSQISIENISLSRAEIIEDIIINPTQDYENNYRIYDYDTAFYNTRDLNKAYPEEIYSIGEIATMRDYQFITIHINPMRFYPAKNNLEVIDEIEIVIRHETTDPQPIYNLKPRISRSFEPLYEALFANYTQIRLPNPDYHDPSLLIIYGNDTDQIALNQLITWKRQRGMVVNHAQANAAGAGTSTAQIKQYIQNAYNTWIDPPDFLLFIGSPTGVSYSVPSFSVVYGAYSDFQYMQLTPGDNVGDIFIGRLTATNTLQFQKQVEKILQYERFPFQGGDTWLSRSLLVADSDASGVSTIIVSRYVKSVIEDFDPTHTFIEQFGPNPTATSMYNNFNTGITNFSFRGLGGMAGFTPTTSVINNPNRLPFCIWITCGTGSMDGSVIDMITRLTPSDGGLTGAIGAMGMATNLTHTAWNNAIHGAIYHGLYPAKMETLGQANLYARAYVSEVYGSPSLYQTALNFATWVNLVGDPSVNVYKAKPLSIITELPTSIPTGTSSLRLAIIDENNRPVPDAWITLSKTINFQIDYLTKAITDENGVGYLEIDPDIDGTLMMVVSRAGYVSKLQVVTPNTGTSVSVRNYLINDISGNNNGELNPGETASLTLNIQNYTDSNVSNLSATISSESSLITFVNDSTTFGAISAGAVMNFYDTFTFTLSPLFPDKTLLPLSLTITDGSDTWVSYITPVVKGLNINVLSMTPQQVPINTSSEIYFSFINNGTYIGYDLHAKLISRSEYIAVIDSTAFLGTIIQNQVVNNSTDPFTIFINPGVFPGLTLNAELYIYTAAGYEEHIPIKIPVGERIPTDPTGPDDYGYIIYDSEDVGYEAVPYYSWKSIRTIGTNTGIVDASASVEEGGANISLPFTASYYGLHYNEIFICSNGWFVFGTTEQKDFRNLPLPGPIAPKAMVAPYWTDLVVGGIYGGGIYTYYDRDENAFIIQWDRLKWVTGYYGWGAMAGYTVSEDSVSFQAIIYDPAYHATGLGDSPIKFQYHRWDNGFQGNANFPFNYVTVGFQDHSELRGLTYVYDNRYSPGSSPLSNGKALLITQSMYLSEEPIIMLSQTAFHDQNNNKIIEPGEYVDIGIRLVNIGGGNATNVRATLTFSSPFIEVINDTALYGDFEVYEISSNQDYYTIYISPDTPDNHTPLASLRITGYNDELKALEWTRRFDFTVEKPNPQIIFRSSLINDYHENNNGIPEAGETVKLIANILNFSRDEIENVEAALSAEHPEINIIKSIDTLEKMNPNLTYQFIFELSIGENLTESISIPLSLTVSAPQITTLYHTINFYLNQGPIIHEHTLESINYSGWTIIQYPQLWSLSQTNFAGGNAPELKVSGANLNGTSRYNSPQIDTREMANVLLTFRHSAVVATPGALTLKIATRANIAGAWSDVWTFPLYESYDATTTSVLLGSNVGGQNFQFSVILTGYMAGIEAWYLDDIVLSAAWGNTAILSGNVNILNNYLDNDITRLSINAGEFATNPSPDSTYILYLQPRPNYDFTLINPYLTGNKYEGWSLTPGALLENIDFDMFYLTPGYNIRSKVDQNQNLLLRWDHLYDYHEDPLNFQYFIVFQQENSMQFNELSFMNEPATFDSLYERYIYNFSPPKLDINKRYRYYVQAVYESGESEISEIKYVDPTQVFEDEDNPWTDGSTEPVKPIFFKLFPNYPNPFNPTTNIVFTIPKPSYVSVKIYNIKGQLVKTLENEFLDKGTHTITWNGDNDYHQNVSSGIYFVRLQNSSNVAVRKMMLIK